MSKQKFDPFGSGIFSASLANEPHWPRMLAMSMAGMARRHANILNFIL